MERLGSMRWAMAAAALLAATAGAAQQAAPATPAARALSAGVPAPPPGWQVPRTPWGDPDLTGTWPLDSVGQTPTERPAALGTKAYLSEAEHAAAVQSAREQLARYAQEDTAGKMGNGHWLERGLPLRQTSLIVEPANGRIPPLTPEGERRSAAMRSSWNVQEFNSIGDFNALDRCITRGLPASMTPFPYNNGIQVFQAPGVVAIRLEIVHETRLVPLGDAPAIPSQVRQWLGSSRGRWEGTTLVIETTNTTGMAPLNIVGPVSKPIPSSTELRITERLTPVGPDTIFYEALVEDPVVLTAPYRIAFPWTRNDDYALFEYACHEGNTIFGNYIRSTSPRFAAERAAKAAGGAAGAAEGTP